MAIIDSMENTGSKLFKYRGQIPVLIFVCALPILFFSNSQVYSHINDNPTIYIITTIISILLIIFGLALRAYTVCTTPKGTSGRNTKSQVANTLNTKGIYSVVRHPLYFANYLIWLGLLVYTMNVFVVIIVSLIYWIYYERIMMAEEAFLRNKFGEEFENWARRVPAFIPKLSLFESGSMHFSLKTFIRREYATILSTLVSFTIIDYVIFFLINEHSLENLLIIRPSLYITIVYSIIAVFIKILKHKTHILDPDNYRD